MKTFQEMYESTLRRMKIPTTDSEALAATKEAINTRYENLAFRKRWRWRKVNFDITATMKLTTGTVAVVNASRSATFSGSSLTALHVGWFLRVDGTNDVYKVLNIDTGTQVALLSAAYVGSSSATATFKLFEYEFGLPPDCEELDLVWHDHRRAQVDIVTPREFLDAQVANQWHEGKAQIVTCAGFKAYEGPTLGSFVLGYDFLNSASANDLKMLVYPLIPSETYVIHTTYVKKLALMVEDADEPLLPEEKRHILVWGALSDMYMRERNIETAKYYDRKFEDMVAELEADMESYEERPVLTVDNRKYYRNAQWDRYGRINKFDYE